MNASLWVVLTILGATVAVTAYFEIFRPLRDLGRALESLSNGDFRIVLLKTRSGLFRGAARHLVRLAEMLQQLDKQVADEGFSLRAILSSMVEGVLIVDRSQRVRLVNEALMRMLRFTQSPINRTAIEVFRNHELQSAIEEALTHTSAQRIEISLEAPDEQGYRKHHFEVVASGLNPKPGAPAPGAVIVFHDITAVTDLEAVRKEFVANVSHEFRTPLAIINGYIETLMDGALEDRPMAENSLRIMHKNSLRLNLLIEDLLTIARLEHRTQQQDFRRINLHDTFQKVLERLEPTIKERHAEIVVEWEPAAEFVEGDERRIEQIYTNLLENALRYGPADHVQIHVAARMQGRSVEIRISDNGPGIPLADQPHIFERFYRVYKDRSRQAGGTGLGLSIVKHIVQNHGGTVVLESTPGEGCTFILTFPATRADSLQKDIE
jgi:two-component system phosphate regulon sensor histidine kinase PhoR